MMAQVWRSVRGQDISPNPVIDKLSKGASVYTLDVANRATTLDLYLEGYREVFWGHPCSYS